MHHAIHHWRADSAWLKQRKRWHALHHSNIEQAACFGVSSGFWDYVFRSGHRRKK
jgi:sterol desaturase/sphingolipid hydroxylase (fatty acid hydroxylase superfamily)